MSKMRVVQVTRPNGPFEIVEREILQPGAGGVRIKVEACGVCHSDAMTKECLWPGIEYPRIPGHEIAGIIDALGAGVAYDGGYAEYMIAPATALAQIPDGLSAVDAGPLMCAGVTTFNSLRHSGARPGDIVAILGIGGLGHLGIQFAATMGFNTVAIARGQDKEPLARKLGASTYIDSKTQDPGAALQKLGGAKVILATVTNGAAMGGLGVNEKLIILGAAAEPLEVPGIALLLGRRSIVGWPSGSSIDSQDTLAFSELTGARAMNEIFPLERAGEAYEHMMSGKARFRAVLTTGK